MPISSCHIYAFRQTWHAPAGTTSIRTVMSSPVPLLGTPYNTRDPIPAARRCVNLYPEKNGEGSVFPTRHWPIPGLRKIAQAPNNAPIRCEYTASNGDLYIVAGAKVYWIAADWSFTELGTIIDRPAPASMA